MMQLPFFFSSFPFLLFFLFQALPAQNLIHQTCNRCAKADPNLSYSFCVTSLQAAPTALRAKDVRELGIVSIKLVRHNLTHTRSYIKKLLKSKKMEPFVRSCLHDCFDLYSNAIPATKQAIQHYKSNHYDDANIYMSSVMDASITCEDGFKEQAAIVSPLTKNNNDTFQLSAISLSIISMLRSITDDGSVR